MYNLLFVLATISGVVSFAEEGVFEGVLYNRVCYYNQIPARTNFNEYVLVGVEDKLWLGYEGKLLVWSDEGVTSYKALVVDVQNEKHRKIASLSSLGLCCDVNRKDLVYKDAQLVILNRLKQTAMPDETKKEFCNADK